jgi:hypothetical protein
MAGNANARRAPGAAGCLAEHFAAQDSATTANGQAGRPCDICGVEAAVWGPGIARCADHFDFDRHELPAVPSAMPRERVLELFARARAAGRLPP